MEKVTGIGGFFSRAKDPAHLRRKPVQRRLSRFPAESDYFGRAEQAWMINFRVRDLTAMVAQFRRAGVEGAVDPETYPDGRFAPPA